MFTVPAHPSAMRDSAVAIDEAFNQLCAIQQSLNVEINDLVTGWQSARAAQFLRDYRSFDRELSSIQQSLDEVHASLVATVRAS